MYCTHKSIDYRKEKKCFHVQNSPCRTVGSNPGYVLGIPVHDQAVVEFGRKVFLVDCLLWKKTYGENNHNRTRSSVFMHTMTESVTIQGNLTAMGYRNDVIRSVLLLLNIRAKYRMMLPRDFASCHAVRSTLLMLVANKVQQLRWPAHWIEILSILLSGNNTVCKLFIPNVPYKERDR